MWSCWTTARRSPKAPRTTFVPIRSSSGRIWARAEQARRDTMQFFFEVLFGGLLSGVMYSLVAIGFVLIFKASGVFNFAQGAMVFFAALTCVSLVEHGLHFWLALPATLAAMVVLGLLTERIVLRPLVNQPPITLFMATIGLSFFIEGLAQLLWGAQPHGLDIGIQDEPWQWITDATGMNVSVFDLSAAGIA